GVGGGAGTIFGDQARFQEDIRRVRLGEPPQQEVGIARRVPDAEALHALLGDSPLGEVGARTGALTAVQQHALVELAGLVDRLVQDRAAAVRSASRRGLALVPQRYAGGT